MIDRRLYSRTADTRVTDVELYRAFIESNIDISFYYMSPSYMEIVTTSKLNGLPSSARTRHFHLTCSRRAIGLESPSIQNSQCPVVRPTRILANLEIFSLPTGKDKEAQGALASLSRSNSIHLPTITMLLLAMTSTALSRKMPIQRRTMTTLLGLWIRSF